MSDAAFEGFTVSAGLSRSLARFAVKSGAPRAALLEAAGIAEEALADPDGRVPFARHVALMRAAKQLCGDPALALRFGATDEMDRYSVVGLLGWASASMFEALEQLNRYGQLMVEVDLRQPGRFSLQGREDGLWLIDTRARPELFPELTESTFARMTAGLRRHFSRQPALKVRVTHPRPDYAALCEEVFGAPVEWSAPRNELLLDPAWPTIPVAREPRYAFGILARHADALLARLNQSQTVRGRIEAALIPVLHKGAPGIDETARAMGMSRATLYRRLRDEGTTFAGVLEDLRRRLALDYLEAGKTSVNEVAYLTGYSDPAAFSRAVKRWTGQSPKALRSRG